MAAELRGWTNFFTQLSSFLVSCERHYGLANQQYTEYAIERLSQQCQSVQAILDSIRRAASADLSSLCTSLTQLLEHLHAILNQWEQYSDTLDIQQVRRYCPPLVPPSSGHGRPRFDISQEQLQYLRSLSFTWTDIADMLMVSRMTVYRRRVQYGLLSDPQSSISDQQLIERVRQLLVQHPHVGQSFISGQLRSQGYRVSRERIRHAVRTCDPLDAALRWQGIATRRHPYSVPGPNSLWHIGNFHHSYIGRSRQCKINA